MRLEESLCYILTRMNYTTFSENIRFFILTLCKITKVFQKKNKVVSDHKVLVLLKFQLHPSLKSWKPPLFVLELLPRAFSSLSAAAGNKA